MHYFISDIHLGILEREADKHRESLLLDFLDKIKEDAKSLYIVGDLFDYWFEYKSVIPKYYYKVLAKLAEINKFGIDIIYLMGNHDFGHFDFFEKELDIHVYKEDLETIIDGKKFYLSHGDGKAYNDAGYRLMKKILRHPLSNSFFRLIHPDFGINLASSSSKSSRSYTDSKDFSKKEGLEDFAEDMIKRGFDYVIMGHRHKINYKQYEDGIYVNLGDWIKPEPVFGQFDGNELKLVNVKEFLSNH